MSTRLSIGANPLVSLVGSRLRSDSLMRNSVYIMVSTALTAASGYLYWIIAAHMYPAHDVGLASALIGTMMLAATLANLGIGPALIQVLPRRTSGDAWSLTLNAVYFTGIVSSLLVGSVAAVVLPFVASKFALVPNYGDYMLVVIAGVPLLTLAALLDSTFTAERAAGNVLIRTAAFALLRIPLLVIPIVLGRAGALVIGLSWVIAAGGSILGGALLIPRLNRAYRLVWHGLFAQVRSMFALVAGHQFISLGALAPIYLMPLFVVARLSFADNAYFYMSWQVGSLFFMVSPSVATALLAEGSNTPESVRKARSSILIIAALLSPAMLIAFLGGHLILSMFGASYSAYGYALLTVLVISAVPDAITNVYVSVLRVRKHFTLAAGLNLSMAFIALALAWIFLPSMGIVGAGWAWLIAQTSGTILVAGHILVTRMRSYAERLRTLWPARAAVERVLLIVDPCSAGEALRLAPHLSVVRREHPYAHITLVANPDALQGFQRIDDVDRVVTSTLYISRPYSRMRARLAQAAIWLRMVWQLGLGYDLVITFYWGGILQNTLGYVVGGHGRRVGYPTYPSPVARVLLSDDLGAFDRTKNYSTQHTALLRAAGIESDESKRPECAFSSDDEEAIVRLLQTQALPETERFIVLHPGSDWACQQWLQDRWAELADALATRYHAALIFTGSANEAAYVDDIRHRMTASSMSLVGQTSLPQVAALLARGYLCVCVDVAVFELTQAVGIPTVVLAGPSRPDTGVFGSWQPTIVKRTSASLAARIVACQDDHNARNVRNCWNYQCEMASLRQIQVADVLQAVGRQVAANLPTVARASGATTLAEDIVPLHPMLEATFAAFNRENIRWSILRGEADLAHPSAHDDIDLLVSSDDMPRIRVLLEAADYLLLPTMGRGSHTFYRGYHSSTETWITLDIVSDLTYGPYLNMPTYAAHGCLRRRRSTGVLYRLAPDDAFWTLFLHCMLDKGMFVPRRAAQLRELAEAARTDSPLARLVTIACPSDWDALRLLACARHGELAMLTQLAPTFALGWRRRRPLSAWWRASFNRAGQLLEIPIQRLRRPGITVALLGPDGAGKSTLVAEIRRVSNLPVRAVYMGLWKSGRKVTREKPGIAIVELAANGGAIAGRMPKAWGRYLLGQVYRALGRVVIFDRYVYDALTSSYQSMSWLKRTYMWALGHACPAPTMVLVLDVPGEIMFTRKGEDTPEALETQRQSLLSLRGSIRNVQVVDAAREIAAVRADVMERIWVAYRRRWRVQDDRVDEVGLSNSDMRLRDECEAAELIGASSHR